MNNSERCDWIDNDEGLYSWWKRSGLTKGKFIQKHKSEIDKTIDSVVNGSKRAHHLMYIQNLLSR